jgi:hypothetical protein
MDNSDTDERIMEGIISRGANAVATYTYEECNQVDRFLNINMISEGGTATILQITRKT